MRHARVDLEIDDSVVQLTGELANLMIETVITNLVQLVDQLHRGAEITSVKAIDQIAGIVFQSRLKVTQRGVIVFHSTLAAGISR